MKTEPLSQAAPISSDDMLAGTPYRVIRPLGRGGMGEVFEALHLALGKRVVVKLLRRELSHDPGLVERLRVEAQAMGRLAHPNIASVHDLGTTPAGRPYFVLELLSGRTVAQELRTRRAIPVEEAIRITLDVLDGLAAAHAEGLVHRDIKPSNIFLCDPDRRGSRTVKILDFGVVKVSASRMPRAFPTEQGQFLGSPAIASPEQARGEEVDQRSDLYAAGLLLFTMIAGKNPFAGGAVPHTALWAQVLTVPPPLSSVAARVSPVLDLIVAKALAKAPADRYGTALQMAAALERALATLPPPEPEAVSEAVVPAQEGDRTAQGTLVQGVPALAGATARDVRRSLPRMPSIDTPRIPPRFWLDGLPRGALIAAATGVLFFALLCFVWSMLRGLR